jgi:uncharacterized protein YoxC
MPQAAVWIAVGLVAVLVAVAVPTLLQLRRTLRVAERTLDSTGKKLDGALDELTGTLDRLNRAAEQLERGTHRVASLFEVLGDIGDAVVKVKSSLGVMVTVGAALGPMLLAAIRGAFGRGEDEPSDSRDADTPARRPDAMEVEP